MQGYLEAEILNDGKGEENCQVGKTGKRSPKWRRLQTRKGKARGNETKGLRTRVRTSGKTNNTPGWPNLHRRDQGRDKHVNRRAKASSFSLPRAGALFSLCL